MKSFANSAEVINLLSCKNKQFDVLSLVVVVGQGGAGAQTNASVGRKAGVPAAHRPRR